MTDDHGHPITEEFTTDTEEAVKFLGVPLPEGVDLSEHRFALLAQLQIASTEAAANAIRQLETENIRLRAALDAHGLTP